MDIQVEIKNFGKIKDAKLNLRDLTVFAGPNDTGKSYVSRALYSIMYSLEKDPYVSYYEKALADFYDSVEEFVDRQFLVKETEIFHAPLDPEGRESEEWESFPTVDRVIENFLEESVRTTKLHVLDLLFSHKKNGANVIEKNAQNITEKVANLVGSLLVEKEDSFIESIESEIEDSSDDMLADNEGYFSELRNCFSELKKNINKDQDEEELVKLGYTYYIKDSLKDNFQVREIVTLVGTDKRNNASISIRFDQNNEISVSIKQNGEIVLTGEIARSSLFHSFRNLIYLESPIFWKIKNPLTRLYRYERRGNSMGNRGLIGVPEYFYDTAYSLEREAPQDTKEAERLKILLAELEHHIGGELRIDPLDKRVKFFKTVNRESTGRRNRGGGDRRVCRKQATTTTVGGRTSCRRIATASGCDWNISAWYDRLVD